MSYLHFVTWVFIYICILLTPFSCCYVFFTVTSNVQIKALIKMLTVDKLFNTKQYVLLLGMSLYLNDQVPFVTMETEEYKNIHIHWNDRNFYT